MRRAVIGFLISMALASTLAEAATTVTGMFIARRSRAVTACNDQTSVYFSSPPSAPALAAAILQVKTGEKTNVTVDSTVVDTTICTAAGVLSTFAATVCGPQSLTADRVAVSSSSTTRYGTFACRDISGSSEPPFDVSVACPAPAATVARMTIARKSIEVTVCGEMTTNYFSSPPSAPDLTAAILDVKSGAITFVLVANTVVDTTVCTAAGVLNTFADTICSAEGLVADRILIDPQINPGSFYRYARFACRAIAGNNEAPFDVSIACP